MYQDGWLLGIDGGGTKTEAWIANRRTLDPLEMIASGVSGPSNPRGVGLDAATREIHLAVEQALAQLDAEICLEAACLAIAGADRDDLRVQLTDWGLQVGLSEKLLVCNDAEPILALTAAGWGLALIAGTGSFAYGKNSRGQVCRVGGWGYRFGDEGSGYAIGAAGIRAALQASDGRAEATCLLEMLMQRLGVAKHRDLIEPLYTPEFGRQQVADFAIRVLEASEQGDSVAEAIIQDAASDLASMVQTVACQLELPSDSCPLAIAGSLLINSQPLTDALLAELNSGGVHVDLTRVPKPVAGALKIASKL